MSTLSLTRRAVRFKLDVLRYRARRVVLRIMRRVLDWMGPPA
jgi:hypothetical protein